MIMEQVMKVGAAYMDLPQEGGVYIVNITGPHSELVETLRVIYHESTSVYKDFQFKTLESIRTTEDFNLPASNNSPASAK